MVVDDVFGRGRDIVDIVSQDVKPDRGGKAIKKLLVCDLAHHNRGVSWSWWPKDVVDNDGARKVGDVHKVDDVPVSASP